MNELVGAYLNAFLISVFIEMFFSFFGIILTFIRKIRNVKEYIVDALLVNLLTSPLIAFGILAIFYVKKISLI